MRRVVALGLVTAGAFLAACADRPRESSGVVPQNSYIGQDIIAARSSEAGDLRDLRPFEPGHRGSSYGDGIPAPGGYWGR